MATLEFLSDTRYQATISAHRNPGHLPYSLFTQIEPLHNEIRNYSRVKTYHLGMNSHSSTDRLEDIEPDIIQIEFSAISEFGRFPEESSDAIPIRTRSITISDTSSSINSSEDVIIETDHKKNKKPFSHHPAVPPVMTASRQTSKGVANLGLVGSAREIPDAKPEQDKTPVEVSSTPGIATSSASLIEGIIGVTASAIQLPENLRQIKASRAILKEIQELNEKETEIKKSIAHAEETNAQLELISLRKSLEEIQEKIANREIEKDNAKHTKNTHKTNRNLNTAIITRFSLSGSLAILRIAQYSHDAKAMLMGALKTLGTVILYLAPFINLIALAIVSYNAYKDAVSLREAKSTNKKIIETRRAVNEMDENLEYLSILNAIEQKQSIKMKKTSLIINIASALGYLTTATGGFLILSYVVGGAAAVAGAAAIITPIGWGIAGIAALAGASFALYKYTQYRNHKAEKNVLENILNNTNAAVAEKREARFKLLSISTSFAANQLLIASKHENQAVREKAVSILKNFLTDKEIERLPTTNEKEAIKLLARKLNIPAKQKKPEEMEKFNAIIAPEISQEDQLIIIESWV